MLLTAFLVAGALAAGYLAGRRRRAPAAPGPGVAPPLAGRATAAEGERSADAAALAALHEARYLEDAFRELERVLGQYERLLPAIRADDPLAEEIAGLAAETADVARAADLPRLRVEIPRAIGRLQRHLAAGSAAAGASGGASGGAAPPTADG